MLHEAHLQREDIYLSNVLTLWAAVLFSSDGGLGCWGTRLSFRSKQKQLSVSMLVNVGSSSASFWSCFGLLTWLMTPPSSQSTSNLLWIRWRWDSILALRRELLPISSSTQPTSSPHPPARPLGLSLDVTSSQPLSLKAAWMWQFWPHRLSLFAVTGHAPASHYANSHS